MTRAELAKMIVLVLGLTEDPSKASAFKDVDSASWYSGYVGALVGSGITQGSSETTFSPDAQVTREELVVFFIRAFGLEKTAKILPADAELADLSEISEWARPHVSLAFKMGFVNGIEDKGGRLKFSPRANAERQALARLAFEFKSNKTKYEQKAAALAAKTDERPSADKPAAPASTTPTGAGGSSGSSGSDGSGDDNGNTTTAPSVSVAEQLASGTELGSITISESGLYGPDLGSGTTTTVTGTLTVDPGPQGTVSLQNIVMGPESVLEVLSGDVNSIKLQQTVIKQLRVNAVNNNGRDVRIETKDGTRVETTEVESQAVLESSSSTGKLGTIKLSSGAAGKSLTLKGGIDDEVSVEAPGSTITLAPPTAGNPTKTTVKSLLVKTNTSVSTSPGTSLSSLNVTGKNTTVGISGQGSVNSVTVDSSASGTKLNIGAGAKIKSLRLDSGVVITGDPESISSLPANTGSGNVSLDDSIKANVQAEIIKTIVAQINSIGEIKAYSAELENRINEVNAKVESARTLYDIKDADISNLSVLDKARNDIVLYKDLSLLEIDFAAGDNASSVTKNIGLKTEGSPYTAISWSSDKEAFIKNDGTVTRPAAGSSDETVALTATLTRHAQFAVTKTFTVTVKAESKLPGEAPDTEAPEQVTGLRAQETLADQVTLTWNAAKDNVAAVGYSVYVNNVKYRDFDTVQGTVYNLSPNTEYSFKVQAYDTSGNAGPFSSALAVTTKRAENAIVVPGSVTDLVYTSRSTYINLKWTAPANATGTVSYAVYKDGVFLRNAQLTSTDITGLLPGTLYQFEVRALNEAGYSDAAVISARTAVTLTVHSVRPYHSVTGQVYGEIARAGAGTFIIPIGSQDADSLIVTFSDSVSQYSLHGNIDYSHAGVSLYSFNGSSVNVTSGTYNDTVRGAVYFQFAVRKDTSTILPSYKIDGLQYTASSVVYQVEPVYITIYGI